MLRLALRHTIVNKYLYTLEKGGESFGIHIVNRAKESKNVAIQYMVCRALCNSFIHEDGLNFLLNDKTITTMIETVLSFKDIISGSLPANPCETHLRVGVATLLLNYAVALSNENKERGECVNATIDMLEKTNDAETNFRLLVALGTLLTGDDFALAVATSRDVVKQVSRLKREPGGQAKVGRCAHQVEKLLI